MSTPSSLASAMQRGLRKLAGGLGQKPSAYRLFDLQLVHKIALSPSLCRLVFTGPDVSRMNCTGPDQRVKLFFPAADGSLPALPHDSHWNDARKQLPEAARPPMRTYTIRALRRAQAQVDIDFVMHGVNGPASAWATHARSGDRLQMLAPNLAYPKDPGGYEWNPPAGVDRVLLVGDETALPAIAGILETLAASKQPPQVQAFVEVPLQADCLDLECPCDTHLHWLPRDVLGSDHGAAMLHAVEHLAELPRAQATGRARPLEEIDIEQRRPWELAQARRGDFYAWVAGESATVMQIRRHLVNDRQLDRACLTLMGYWRAGRSFE